MAFKEMLLGVDYKNKSTTEKLARLSKMVDAGTVLGALVFFGIAPVVALAAIEEDVDGFLGDPVLEFVSDKLKNDRELVIASVKRSGRTLKFAGQELKNDKDLVLAAVDGGLATTMLFFARRIKRTT